jgi:putative ABC transport system substrate-binding protein
MLDLKRREFITLLGGAAAAWPLAARAQQPAMPVIGFLGTTSAADRAPFLAAFRQGLKEAGYVEGQSVAVEYRWANGANDRLPELAADLARQRVAVIAAPGTVASIAAAKATTTIPVVFNIGSDPVRHGLVTSLNKPGGNATGVHSLTDQLITKRLGLLHDLAPDAAGIAVLVNPRSVLSDSIADGISAAARTIGKPTHIFRAGTSREIDAAFEAIVQQRMGALMTTPDQFFTDRRVQIITLATRHLLPAIYSTRELALAGGLMSYGISQTESYRQVGVYTGRILKGEKPGDLPVMQPTKFEFVINLKTAKALGLTIPESLLATADEVIQ